MKDLSKIGEDLFQKIRGRFPSITIGDEDGNVTNEPNEARFFDFDYQSGKRKLGKVSISISEDDGLSIIYSRNFMKDENEITQKEWYNFLRELRKFSKKRLLNFDVRDISKTNLTKRDYKFLAATRSGEKTMNESKLYGTGRMSYQNLDNARIVIKHNENIDQENPAARTKNINSIYIENSEGERFKYPYRHLSGARAMARHVAEGGKPYDDFGSYITELSEEMWKLRKFKNYVGRSSVMAESLESYMDVVKERVNTIKKTIEGLQKRKNYLETIESFEKPVFEDVPEDVKENWIDQLTIRQFNEELKDVFPYIYRLIGEGTRVKELGPEDLVDEDDDPCWKGYKQVGMKKKGDKKVPNCVPEEAELESIFDEMMGQFSEAKKPDFNFGPEDLQKLQRIKDLKKAKEFALELITKNSIKPMQPKKVSWFQRAIDSKKSVMDIVKMMYDMMLSGEGNSVIGTTKGMSPNSYRQKFKDDDGKDLDHDGDVDSDDYMKAKDIAIKKAMNKDKKEKKESKTPLSEFILSYFDYTTGQFPKGETAVLTMVEKDYGEKFIKPAKKFIEQINNRVAEVMGYKEESRNQEDDYEFNRVKQLAGLN